jgi:hypothetical protein
MAGYATSFPLLHLSSSGRLRRPMKKQYNVAVLGYRWASAAHIAALNATSGARVIAVSFPGFIASC